MEYMTLKEASEKWGVFSSKNQLLLFCRPHYRCGKERHSMADSHKC